MQENQDFFMDRDSDSDFSQCRLRKKSQESDYLKDIITDLQNEIDDQKQYFLQLLESLKEGAVDNIIEKEDQIQNLKEKITQLIVFMQNRKSSITEKEVRVKKKMSELHELEDQMKKSIQSNLYNYDFIKEKHMAFLKTQMDYEHEILDFKNRIRLKDNKILDLKQQLNQVNDNNKKLEKQYIISQQDLEQTQKQNDILKITCQKENLNLEAQLFDQINIHQIEINNQILEINKQNNSINKQQIRLIKYELQEKQSQQQIKKLIQDNKTLREGNVFLGQENTQIKQEYQQIRTSFMKEQNETTQQFDLETTLDFSEIRQNQPTIDPRLFLIRSSMMPTQVMQNLVEKKQEQKKLQNMYFIHETTDSNQEDSKSLDNYDNQEIRELNKRIEKQQNLINYYKKKYEKYKLLKQQKKH